MAGFLIDAPERAKMRVEALDRGTVTIGIPTFNRCEQLRRAVDSARAQDYGPFEVVICDNASHDGTSAFAQEVAGSDAMVRYIRHPQNLGPIANFESALCAARGEYFMWLADDDWIEPNYVSECVKAIEADPRVQLVAGRTVYHQDGNRLGDERPTKLDASDASQRVVDYYRAISGNGVFYGVARTRTLRQLLPLKRRMAEDWRIVAALVYAGVVQTIDETRIHRGVAGVSVDLKQTAQQLGLNPLAVRFPSLAAAYGVVADILTSPVYRSAGPLRRVSLSLRCGSVMARWLILREMGKLTRFMALSLRSRSPDGFYRAIRGLYRTLRRS